jgi:transposase InsO family protein
LTDSDIIDLQPITTSNTRTVVHVLARKGPSQKVKAIVDGGSAISFVSADLARDLGLKPDRSRQIEFFDVNGNRTTSAGHVNLLFSISGERFRTGFQVAPDPPAGVTRQWRMIIGTNVFAAAKMIVDYERKEIYRKKGTSTRNKLLLDEEAEGETFAVLDAVQGAYVDVPAGKRCDLPVRLEVAGRRKCDVSERIDDRDGEVALSAYSGPKTPPGLVVLDALVAPKRGHAMARIKNDGPSTTRLYGGQKIAVVERLSPKAIVAVVETRTEDAAETTRGRPKRGRSKVVGLEDMDLGHLKKDGRARVRRTVRKFAGMFPPSKTASPLAVRVRPLRIDTGDAEPIYRMQHRLSPRHRQAVVEQTRKWLADGVIVPSKSRWNSSTVCVRKKDGSTRVCLDLRPLNATLAPVPFHLPHIKDTIASLQGAKWFTKLDQLSAFTQLPLDDKSSERMSFTTPLGRFQMARLPFGLATAPAHQQLFLTETLAAELGVSVYVYLDDILVFTRRDLEDHMRVVERVLEKLAAIGASLKLSKCEFAKPSVEWLGFVIDEHGHRISKERTRDIADTPTPTSTREVRQFLGKIAFIKHFIPQCTAIAAPLYKLTPLHKRFQWGPEEQAAFDRLQKLTETSGLLWFPQVGKPYTIYADGSGIGCGGWLTQMVDGKPRALAACSRRFEPREMRSHNTTEREAAAIRFCLDSFKHFIAGEPGLTVVTDHKPLVGALDPQKEPSSTRLKRIAMAISEYSPKIVWEAGKFNVAADALSRQPLGDAPPPDEVYAYAANRATGLVITAESQRTDPKLARIMDALQAVEEKRRRNQPISAEEQRAFNEVARDFYMHDGRLFRIWHPGDDSPGEEPAIVPFVPSQQRADAFSFVHDHPTHGGHQGRDKTLEKMRQHFYWPGMRRDITKWVATCETCQLTKIPRHARGGPLKPIQSMHPFDQISMDVMDATERGASGARWILVIQDSASGLLAAAPLTDLSGDTAAAAFKQAWLKPYPKPLRIITDNGTNLAQGRMKELCESLEIQLATTEPGRAQGNGRAERAVQTLKGLLTASRRTDDRLWDEHLDDAVKAYNTALQASLGYAPERIAFGVVPQLLGAANEGARRLAMGLAPRTVEDHMLQHEAVRSAAADNMRRAQARQKGYFDRRRRVIRFMPGSLVRMLRKPTERTKGRKFESPWIGPLVVVEEKRPDVYRLQHRDTGRMVNRTVNVERLAPFLEREGLTFTPPPGRRGPVQGTFEPSDDTDGTIVDSGVPHQQRSDQVNEEDADDAASVTTASEDLEPQPLVPEEAGTDANDLPSPSGPDAQPDAQEAPDTDSTGQSESETPTDASSTSEDSDAQPQVQEDHDAPSDTQGTPGGDASGQPEHETHEAQSDAPRAPEPDNQTEPEKQPLRRSARIAQQQQAREQQAQKKGTLFLMISPVRRLFQRVRVM